jgi:hypothetical protein
MATTTQKHSLAFTLESVDIAVAEVNGHQLRVTDHGGMYIADFDGEEDRMDNIYLFISDIEDDFADLVLYAPGSHIWREGEEE